MFGGIAANAYADRNQGYVYTSYGEVLRGVYGKCVHTAYFDPSNGLAECGEGPKVVAPAPKPTPTVVIETVSMSDADDVLFAFDQANLSPHGRQVIDGLITKFNQNGDVTKITIDGYTDGIGTEAYNLKLSDDRAKSVKNEFVARGVPTDIIVATGHGMQDIATSKECFSRLGGDKIEEIYKVEHQLKEKQFKARKLSKKVAQEKKSLESKLTKLQSEQVKLKACTAPDRKVVFTVEHTQQVEKTVSGTTSQTTGAAVNN